MAPTVHAVGGGGGARSCCCVRRGSEHRNSYGFSCRCFAATGYHGVLCSLCDEGYSKNSDRSCSVCGGAASAAAAKQIAAEVRSTAHAHARTRLLMAARAWRCRSAGRFIHDKVCVRHRCGAWGAPCRRYARTRIHGGAARPLDCVLLCAVRYQSCIVDEPSLSAPVLCHKYILYLYCICNLQFVCSCTVRIGTKASQRLLTCAARAAPVD